MPPLLIVDTPWLLYRSFFALPKSIVGAQSKPVNALLGTVNALLSAIDAFQPRAVVCCTGAEDAHYRVKLFPPYHAHRDPMPKELAQQWDLAPRLLEAFNWTVVDAGQLEADDAIGALAAIERAAGGQSLLFTGDKDLFQAVSESASFLEMRRGDGFALVGPKDVFDRSQVSPDLIPDLIALKGDPSDGIPGARRVGAKTAAALLAQHRSLQGVLAAAREVPPQRPITRRIAAALIEDEGLLLTFKEIATLQPVHVERPLDAETDFAAGAKAASDLGMLRLAERLEARIPA